MKVFWGFYQQNISNPELCSCGLLYKVGNLKSHVSHSMNHPSDPVTHVGFHAILYEFHETCTVSMETYNNVSTVCPSTCTPPPPSNQLLQSPEVQGTKNNAQIYLIAIIYRLSCFPKIFAKSTVFKLQEVNPS